MAALSSQLKRPRVATLFDLASELDHLFDEHQEFARGAKYLAGVCSEWLEITPTHVVFDRSPFDEYVMKFGQKSYSRKTLCRWNLGIHIDDIFSERSSCLSQTTGLIRRERWSMLGRNADLIVEPAIAFASGYNQLGESLGAHLNPVDINRRQLLHRDLVDSSINDDQLGMGVIDRTLNANDLLSRQLRIDL